MSAAIPLDFGPQPAPPPRARSARAQRDGFLRDCFADYRKFCGLIQILPKTGPRQQLVLNEIQHAYCDARTSRDIILKPRQVGMTTEEQARDVFHFLTVPGARVTLMCQSVADQDSPDRALARNFNVMFDGLRQVGVPLRMGKSPSGVWVLPESDAVLRVMLAGASQQAASKKGRSGTITRLHTTETAFWEYASDTLNATIECVPEEPGTEIVHESTPNGASGKFHEDYQAAARGLNGYRAHFFPWWLEAKYRVALRVGEVVEPKTDREIAMMVAGATAEQLKWYRQKVAQKGQDLVDQEYASDAETCFLVAGRKYFDRDALKRLLANCREAPKSDRVGLKGEGLLRVWEPPHPAKSYLISADSSEGLLEKWTPQSDLDGGQKSKHDAAAAMVWDRATGKHVATLWGMFRPGDLAALCAQLGVWYNTAEIAPERNNHGHAVLQALESEHKYRRIYRSPGDGRLGWQTSAVSRPNALSQLESDVRSGLFKTDDRALVGQMLSFVIDKHGKPSASTGAHDDLVLTAAIGWDLLRKPERHVHEVGAGWTAQRP